MVAVDAFSQALTNPLLSQYVYNEETFSAPGWAAIQSTGTFRDVLDRNTPSGQRGNLYVGLTLPGWMPSS
jgi:prostaglandin-endoperoxide synthase 2